MNKLRADVCLRSYKAGDCEGKTNPRQCPGYEIKTLRAQKPYKGAWHNIWRPVLAVSQIPARNSALKCLSNFPQPACQIGNGPGGVDHRGEKRLAKTHARLKSYMCLKLLTFTIGFSWSPFKKFTPTMLQIVSVSDLVMMCLKLNFDMRILIRFQASECSWRDVVAGLQVASIFMGEKGEKQSPPQTFLYHQWI